MSISPFESEEDYQPPAWTPLEAARASVRGWGIYNCADNGPSICRSASDLFETDEDAVSHVRANARTSVLCAVGLAYVQQAQREWHAENERLELA